MNLLKLCKQHNIAQHIFVFTLLNYSGHIGLKHLACGSETRLDVPSVCADKIMAQNRSSVFIRCQCGKFSFPASVNQL